MIKDDFLVWLGAQYGVQPREPLEVTPELLADIFMRLGLVTKHAVEPPPRNYSMPCPVCRAVPHRECEGRAKNDPHPQRMQVEWAMQLSDLEDRIEVLEQRLRDEEDQE
jgi:hypothetical protein